MIESSIKHNVFLKAIILVCSYYFILNGLVYLLFNIIDLSFFDSNNKIQVIELTPLLLILILALLIFKQEANFELTNSIKTNSIVKSLLLISIISILIRVLNDPIYRAYEIFGNLKLPESQNYNSVPMIDQIVLLIKVVLVAPIIEEIFFRGVILRMFINKKQNIYLSLFISSILFSFIHYNFLLPNYLTVLSTFILGIFLGLIYIRWGVFYCILSHGLYNLVWFILQRNREAYRYFINKLDYSVIYWGVVLISLLSLLVLSKNIINGYSRRANN